METYKSSNKTMLRIDLWPKPKVWYQFLKHSLKPIVHNETVNKARLVLVHCITIFSLTNISKIIVQEIQACSKRNDRMICFLCIIISLCKRLGVLERSTDEIYYPQVGFDKAAILNLLKPKGENKQKDACQKMLEGRSSFNNEELLWGTFLQMQKDQREFFRFVRD